jgi:2-(1,2-epoxy-1,2-dihydrophenyl)acetyl-CoA isomerase
VTAPGDFDELDPTLQIEDLGGGVTLARVRRPPNNFFDEHLIASLASTAESLGKDPANRVMLLCSEGKNFCAGADFATKRRRSTRPLGIYSWALDLMASELPIVAAIQGAAVGGGAGLALAADTRVGTPSTRFSLNFARLGISQGFGLSETLREVVGDHRALNFLLAAETIGGEQAHAIGLLDHLVPEEQLESAAIERARAIAANAPLAVRAIRKLLREDRIERLRSVVEREGREQSRLMKTQDFREGLRAAAERCDPIFEGK